jgi:hypothetical protein
MNVLFVLHQRVNAGSIQAVRNYVRVGAQLGHCFALYGRPDPRFPGIRFSTRIAAFDHVVFIVESSLKWMSALRMPRILERVPRERRAILDADGMYNQVIAVDGYDRNHATLSRCAEWRAHFHEVSDRIFQPTLNPCEPGVVALPFYGFNPDGVVPPEAAPAKRFDIVHLGHNWWRGKALGAELLPAIERIRPRLEGILFVGSWWNGPPPATPEEHAAAFWADGDAFRRLRIQVRPAVPHTQVVGAMSEGRVNLMTQRPLFRHLRLMTSKYFEIFQADTIPLVLLDADHAASVYGPEGSRLALGAGIDEKLVDALAHRERYGETVSHVRAHLAAHHSYRVRVRQLVAALDR